MKVKVSYTVDFEEIPTVIREIVDKSQDLQAEMAELSSGLRVGDLGLKSLKDINRIKAICNSLLESYSDCESILTGYLSAALSPPQKQGEVENVDS